MIRVVIVEDETSAAELLKEYIDRYSAETGTVFSVETFPNPIPFLENYKGGYDIVFMDIEMAHMDGMQASYILREKDSVVTLIFVTNMARFAIKGYEVDALDFMVKPLKYHDFAFRLKKAVNRINANQEKFVSINVRGGCVKLPVSHIKYVEIMQHRIVFHSEEGDFETYGTLKMVEDMLKDAHFERCNSCYLVNLQFVNYVKEFTVDVAGEKLKISQPKKKDFMKALNDYIGGGC